MSRFDRDVSAAPRPKHADVTAKPTAAVQVRIIDFARNAEIGRDSIGIALPEKADPLRFSNALSSYCNVIGGPGWAKVGNQNDGTFRIWKKSGPDLNKLAKA